MIYLLSTRVYLIFSVHKFATFLSKPCKVHFEGLVHLLINITNNYTLGLKNYAEMKDTPLSDLLRKAIIENENQLIALYAYSAVWSCRTVIAEGVFLDPCIICAMSI